MKILSASQFRELDAYTIEHEPIASIDLMERASRCCVNRLVKLLDPNSRVLVFCGTGNNGGDGLAITRMLLNLGFEAKALLIKYSEQVSADNAINAQRLQAVSDTALHEITEESQLPGPDANTVAIDALLGTGIHKTPEGLLAASISLINQFSYVVSIDIPSGLHPDVSSSEHSAIVRSHLTLTFHAVKLAFLLPENFPYVPAFEVLDIGLSQSAHAAFNSRNFYVNAGDLKPFVKTRQKFSHKGSHGHALLLAGSAGKGGAAMIASKACLRSGAGYLSVHSTHDILQSLVIHLPEALGVFDSHPEHISEVQALDSYDALAIGPGIGTHHETQTVLKKILQYYTGELVIDADGLNILSENKTWLNFLPAETILTPHPKEFERLNGKWADDFERLECLRAFSVRYNCLVILKGAHSAIAMPDGNVFFNASGNPGLAKAGSGDGLTGILLGLLARGYSAPQAALLGTYVHGLAADLCVKKTSLESLLISDVINKLPKAFYKLEK